MGCNPDPVPHTECAKCGKIVKHADEGVTLFRRGGPFSWSLCREHLDALRDWIVYRDRHLIPPCETPAPEPACEKPCKKSLELTIPLRLKLCEKQKAALRELFGD